MPTRVSTLDPGVEEELEIQPCPNGHEMKPHKIKTSGWQCAVCDASFPRNSDAFRCRECDPFYDMCSTCAMRPIEKEKPPRARDTAYEVDDEYFAVQLGKAKHVEGAEVYVTGMSEAAEAGVIVVGDLWGWNSGRLRAIADHLAFTLEAYVVVPKLLDAPPFEGGTDGDGLPPDFALAEMDQEMRRWLGRYLWETLEPKVKMAVGLLRSAGAKRIGGIGFCSGAWIMFHTSRTCGDFVGGVAVYPSIHLVEALRGEANPEVLAAKVSAPFLFLPARDDPPVYDLGGDVCEAVAAMFPRTDAHTFSTMEHGWVLRGDADDTGIKAATEEAVKLATDFLRKFVWPPPPGGDARTLCRACYENKHDDVKLLLDAKIPPSGKDSMDSMGFQPLHYAAKAGAVTCMKLLVLGEADLNSKCRLAKATALHMAISDGKTKGALALLRMQAMVDAVDKAMQTPLHYAAIAGFSDVAVELLAFWDLEHDDDASGLIAMQDDAGQTALHHAAWNGRKDMVILLLGRQAAVDCMDMRHFSPAERAAQLNHGDVKDILDIERGRREDDAFHAEHGDQSSRTRSSLSSP